ncbi:MAG: dCTP deaminase [Candidatus Uhrbacteria bacterium]|nr:dCTP deaminase [Patescibacteria group bacterium]MBU1906946.1 dCTP deaminase [Patescibacteria group bacterium]
MILTGNKIREEVENNRIEISPFDPDRLTTNSYDLSLGSSIIRYTSEIIDPRTKPEYVEMKLPEDGLVLNAGDFVLGHSKERIGSDFFVPLIHGKSGTARMGLFVHVTADLIDIGSHGVSTFQLYATLPVCLYPNMLIAQVSFWVPDGDIVLYKGKYQNSTGPRFSLTYKDFKYDIFKKD